MTHMHIAGQLAPQPCIPCLLADSSSVPNFLPESSKCRVGFGKSVIDFHVNAGFYGEGASQVGERIGSIQWLVIHKDVWLVIHLLRSRLVHDFCLLCADGKTKVVASSRKVIHALLHFHLLLLLRAQSSAKRSSLSLATFTFVFALSRLRLNTPPSGLYFSWMPSSLSCEASRSIAADTMLKRVGARTQPCFPPCVTGNESEVSPLSRTVALIPSCNWRTSAVNFLGQPNFFIICHSPSLQTVSNALVKSMNIMKRSSYCS